MTEFTKQYHKKLNTIQSSDLDHPFLQASSPLVQSGRFPPVPRAYFEKHGPIRRSGALCDGEIKVVVRARAWMCMCVCVCARGGWEGKLSG